MSLAKIIAKTVSMPLRIVDIPFRIMRELVETPDSDRGVLPDIADATEKAVEDALEGRK